MTEYTDKVTLVISNGVYKNASDVFNVLDDDSGGARTFSVRLSSDGGATVTHRGACTPLPVDVDNALRNFTTQQIKDFVNAKATQKGRTPVGSITAFPNNLVMSEPGADPLAHIASLGLVLYEDPEET